MPPACPILEFSRIWGSYDGAGTGRPKAWESYLLQPTRQAWLKFEVAGDAGRPGVRLTLSDPRDGTVFGEILPDKVPGATWRSAYVRMPARPFVIRMSASPGTWVAFSEPVEMAGGSYWAWRVVRQGTLLTWGVAAGLAALAAGWFLWPRLGRTGLQPGPAG